MAEKFYLDHIGYLVKDVDRTIEALTLLPDVKLTFGPESMGFSAEQLRVGKPFMMKGCTVDLGGVTAELIEPIPEQSEGSYMINYMAEHGDGLHHIAYHFTDVPLYEQTVQKLLDAGWTIGHQGCVPMPTNGVKVSVHYMVAPPESGNLIVELKCDI